VCISFLAVAAAVVVVVVVVVVICIMARLRIHPAPTNLVDGTVCPREILLVPTYILAVVAVLACLCTLTPLWFHSVRRISNHNQI
jgi:uncharacterized membrane protein YecN with MAPEG domain